MNLTSTLTSKGQVTIPVSVRSALGLRQGDRIDFIETDQGFFIAPATSSIRQLKGVVPKTSVPVSLVDMEAAIAEGASASAK
ncbi:MAG: AbrB/MazE/SpoVT family DNA-binding domain-containing protein [Azoarcus sp.]|jgi:AbrB family looped-hinge helix DNA binding protein|nr:AbrB/MazE/SpoVT family DNA-binding domain-containing protein [Azoarcus sp.]